MSFLLVPSEMPLPHTASLVTFFVGFTALLATIVAQVRGRSILPELLVIQRRQQQEATNTQPHNLGIAGSQLLAYFDTNLQRLYSEHGEVSPRVSQYYDLFAEFILGDDGSAVEAACSPEASSISQLTRDVQVLNNVHSHNDYWRKLPLFEALAYGVNSVEADVWLMNNDTELAVGHNNAYLDPIHRNLQSLYTGPLLKMLDEVNCGTHDEKYGVFYDSPETTLYLYIDFKSEDNIKTYELLMQKYFKPLIEMGYLTYYDMETKLIIWRPLTVILTGDYPTDIKRLDNNSDTGYFNTKQRFVFVDAPLQALTKDYLNVSVVASCSLSQLLQQCSSTMPIVRIRGHLTAGEIDCIKQTTSKASEYGLRTRVWGVPQWPIYTRNNLWLQQLQDLSLDFLNVDDLQSVANF